MDHHDSDSLAKSLRDLQAKIVANPENCLDDVREAGMIITGQRMRLGNAELVDWLRDKCGMYGITASAYVTIAHAWEFVSECRQLNPALTIDGAFKAICIADGTKSFEETIAEMFSDCEHYKFKFEPLPGEVVTGVFDADGVVIIEGTTDERFARVAVYQNGHTVFTTRPLDRRGLLHVLECMFSVPSERVEWLSREPVAPENNLLVKSGQLAEWKYPIE